MISDLIHELNGYLEFQGNTMGVQKEGTLMMLIYICHDYVSILNMWVLISKLQGICVTKLYLQLTKIT